MSRAATARLFVAVELPPAVREQLVGWARQAAAALRAGGGAREELRLLDADSLHLTLCFLGSRPVGEIDVLAHALGGCAEDACELALGAPLWLPPRRPHALAVEVHDRGGTLALMQARVVGALADISDWQPERRRFRPHVTVARVRGGAKRRGGPGGRRRERTRGEGHGDGSGPRGRGRFEAGAGRSQGAGRPEGTTGEMAPGAERPLPATPRLSFAPEALVLFRSWLDPAGASYEELASCTLPAL